MNQSQELGEGWLDGECYIVRDGVYIGSAILVLISLASIISSAIIAIRQADKGTKQVHAQAEWDKTHLHMEKKKAQFFSDFFEGVFLGSWI